MVRALDCPPLHGPWHLAPNLYSTQHIPGGNGALYQRAKLGCLPGGAGHGGRDIDADSDDKTLRAAWDGTVHRYGWDDFGNHLGVINSDGEEAFYAHLRTFHVKDGQKVAADDDLGIMGATGQATGIHTHFELRTKATDWCTAIDPTSHLLATLQPPEADMYIIRKQSVAQLYNMLGNCLVPLTPNEYALMGSPKVHTLADNHWVWGLPKLDPSTYATK